MTSRAFSKIMFFIDAYGEFCCKSNTCDEFERDCYEDLSSTIRSRISSMIKNFGDVSDDEEFG